jgi:glycosyltransferase involved in cell wall biosynthesis
MLVSILINNYNYDRFLREAIDSALNQTHPHTEVIVVDDGSTDNSREIIASYGDRIIPVLKENGGQASAVNAGFAVSRGDVVCFLDSDDVFFREKVSLVLEAWKKDPRSCMVYHQLQIVDAQKEKLGRPWPRAVWRGNIKHRVERSGGWWPYPTTSGLCFSRSYLERMLPMPTGPYVIWPDTYLAAPAPFFGPIIGLRVPLTLYRFHGENDSTSRRIANDQFEPQRKLEMFQHTLNQYNIEYNVLKETLHKRLNITSSISLEDHLVYQRYYRAAGNPVSLSKVIFTAIKSPALPPSMNVREVVNILLDRW